MKKITRKIRRRIGVILWGALDYIPYNWNGVYSRVYDIAFKLKYRTSSVV